MPDFDIEVPDGRTVTVEAADVQNALRGAREWFAANGAKKPIHRIQAPDGSILRIEAADEATALRGAQEWFAANSEPKDEGVGNSAARGMNKGLTDVLGAPVDLSAWLLNQTAGRAARAAGYDVDFQKNPLGGSKGLREGLDAAGRAVSANPDLKMAYENRNEEIPRGNRWAASAGEALGGALPPAAAVGQAARSVDLAARAAPTLNPFEAVLAKAAADPARFARTEAGIAIGGAQGAGLASLFAPDSELAPVVGQIAGSVMLPASLVSRAAGGLADRAKDFAGQFTQAGRETRAAAQLNKLMLEAGEDPQTVLRALDNADAVGVTAGQRAGSRTLLGIEARTMEENPEFAAAVGARKSEAERALRADLADTVGPGDASALTRAAEARAARAADLAEGYRGRVAAEADEAQGALVRRVDDFISQAEARAADAAARFERDPEARAAANIESRRILNTAYDGARSVERGLWGALDLEQRVPPTNTRAALKEARRFLLPGERLPVGVEGVAARLDHPSIKAVRAEVLQRARSTLLERAREAVSGANPDRAIARAYATVADGILNDLSTIRGADEARSFSRALHDRWSRTFAGETQRTAASGADNLRDVMTLESAMSGSAPQKAARVRDMREAASPLDARTPDRSSDFMGQAEAYVRERVGALRDPATGTLNPDRAMKFANDNAELLSLFPNLRRDIEGTARAIRAAGTDAAAARAAGKADMAAIADTAAVRTARADRLESVLNRQSTFARVLKAGEHPENAVRNALAGASPYRDFGGLARLARKGGEEALGGLRSATLDHVTTQAQAAAKDAGGFWSAFHESLTSPLSAGANGNSLLNVMKANGVLNLTQSARLTQIAKRGMALEKATAQSGTRLRDLGPATDDLLDFALRAAGANYGSSISIAGKASGAPLVAAGAGSKLFRKFGQALPAQKVSDMLMEAAQNEDLMRALLTKAGSKGFKRAQAQLNAVLFGAGVSSADRRDE